MELLAPAKDIEIAKTAINCGADAVYIGASDFGARKAAANSVSDIEKLCKYAHFYKSKVYVTLNTIIYQNEIPNVENLIRQLYNAGVDALIIQDLGILQMDIPPIELHASTQMHNFDINRIKFFDNLGFKRIVLARECSLEQIKLVKQTIKAEIECFVHGALCVSFSGQCYMSCSIGGRSANRGECAQACRLRYTLKNNNQKTLINNKYLLSLKDLNLSSVLPQMLNAGVDSLKIEGRLKDRSYVSDITAYYRNLLDVLLEEKHQLKNSSGKIFYDFTPDVNKVFNRGFTKYFFDDLESKTAKMANFQTPKFIGEFVGKIKKIDFKTIQLSKNVKINNGDGFTYFVDNQLFGFRAEKVENNNIFVSPMPKNLTVETEVFRNLDTSFSKKLENSKTSRKICVKLSLTDFDDKKILISATDEDNLTSEYIFDNNFQTAQKTDFALENLKKSLQKGGENFYIENVDINLKIVPFIPNSIINEARRLVLQLLENKRIETFKNKDFAIPAGQGSYYLSQGDYKLNVANNLSKQFYLNHNCKVSESAFELLKNISHKEVMTTKYCIRRETGNCPKTNKKVSKDWLTSDFILQNDYKSFILKFDCHECVMRIFEK